MLCAKDIAAHLRCKNPEAANMLDRILRVLASHSVLNCSVVEDDNPKLGSFKRLYSLAPLAKHFACNDDGVSLGPFIALAQHKVYLDSWLVFFFALSSPKTLEKVKYKLFIWSFIYLKSDWSLLFHLFIYNLIIILWVINWCVVHL